MAQRKEPRSADAILDQLLASADAATAFEQSCLLDDPRKAVAERALNTKYQRHSRGFDEGIDHTALAPCTSRV
jgi:putative transposase